MLAARTASAGLNSEIAAFLRTPAGTVFVKGRPVDHPGAVTQRREAAINSYVRSVAPRLLWHLECEGWDLLCFQYIAGRHADYAPGSPDLSAVADAMATLATVVCPDLPEIKRAEQRWAGYLDGPPDAEMLAGDALLHTDYNPLNILVTIAGAQIIDWAWPTRGAAWIDPACWALRLIAAGHRPDHAAELAKQSPAFGAAPDRAIAAFALANSRLWAEITGNDPQPWKKDMARAAHAWSAYRT
ncbi:MAG TPA: aminoglycoside phosphotransferase [Pseudonocardiaceae bacterium]|nr:aminoglycoside phosphotransferase [Pseudonocardiaceae bacterium]